MKTIENILPLRSEHPLWEVRVSISRPIAQHQWSLVVKRESGELPSFDPGNFCMLSFPDLVDPVAAHPFAIASRQGGDYEFIYRVTGKFTRLLTRLNTGSRLRILGPLGRGINPASLQSGKQIFVAGGVGFASILPLLEVAKSSGASTHLFYGVRTEAELIRRGNFSHSISSDDGSIGFHGRLHELMKTQSSLWTDASAFYICGPTLMMKAIYDLLPKEKSYYFMEETMGCGVGICVGCVVPLEKDGQKKYVRSCIEGPIFNGRALSVWRSES